MRWTILYMSSAWQESFNYQFEICGLTRLGIEIGPPRYGANALTTRLPSWYENTIKQYESRIMHQPSRYFQTNNCLSADVIFTSLLPSNIHAVVAAGLSNSSGWYLMHMLVPNHKSKVYPKPNALQVSEIRNGKTEFVLSVSWSTISSRLYDISTFSEGFSITANINYDIGLLVYAPEYDIGLLVYAPEYDIYVMYQKIWVKLILVFMHKNLNYHTKSDFHSKW